MLVVHRSKKNPILSPERSRVWESVATFNPSAVVASGVTNLFYRAMARPDVMLTPYAGLSTIGHAIYENEEVTNRTQVIVPSESWDVFGCEDPRATLFEGKWYVFYTALGGFPFGPGNIKVAVAVGDSPTALSEKHLVTPFNAKAATLFPERINGEAVLLLTCHTDYTDEHPRPTIAIARSKNVEDFWNPVFWERWHETLPEHAISDVRRTDSDHIETGAAPIRTDAGWVFIYSHMLDYYDESKRSFGIEVLLLDLNDPRKVIARTPSAILVTEESYERFGMVPNIVFPSGATVTGDTLRIFYGAADTVSGVAALSLSDLLSSMDTKKRDVFLKRADTNPILLPIAEHPWEARAVFNTAAIEIDGVTHLLYRAMGMDNTSVLGYARLDDGIHVSERLPEPVYVPREPFEQKKGDPNGNSGCEDPRITQIDDTLYLTYTAYDGVAPPKGAISSISVTDFVAKRFEKFTLPRLVTPEGVNDKDIGLFPGKVGGKYMLIHRIDPNICADQFDDLSFTRTVNRCVELMTPRKGCWDAEKIGVAGTPIKIPEGWLFVYHAVGSDHVYRLGAAVIDEAGTHVISRSALPIFEPVEIWEKEGQINNVVFSCGMAVKDDTLYMYYGGGDTVIGVATIPLSTLMQTLLPKL